jgi:hypothetical protein
MTISRSGTYTGDAHRGNAHAAIGESSIFDEDFGSHVDEFYARESQIID